MSIEACPEKSVDVYYDVIKPKPKTEDPKNIIAVFSLPCRWGSIWGQAYFKDKNQKKPRIILHGPDGGVTLHVNSRRVNIHDLPRTVVLRSGLNKIYSDTGNYTEILVPT